MTHRNSHFKTVSLQQPTTISRTVPTHCMYSAERGSVGRMQRVGHCASVSGGLSQARLAGQSQDLFSPLQATAGLTTCCYAAHYSCRGLQPWSSCRHMHGTSQTGGPSITLRKINSMCWHRCSRTLGMLCNRIPHICCSTPSST
jgi:hypothetical protein